MHKYTIEFSSRAARDILHHRKSGNLPLYRKLETLIEELKIHPRTGTGKPEQLKHGLSGKWSRRINDEHRLIYSINDEIVSIEVISAKGHYE